MRVDEGSLPIHHRLSSLSTHHHRQQACLHVGTTRITARMHSPRTIKGNPKSGYAHQLIERGLVLAAMAGSTHLTSMGSPPAPRLRYTADCGADSDEEEVSESSVADASADTSVKGVGCASSSDENMNRAVAEVAMVLEGTPHGWAVKAVAAAKRVKRVKRRIMVKGSGFES